MFHSQLRSLAVLVSVVGLVFLGAPVSRADQGARPKATPVQLAENLIRPAVVYIEGDLSAYVGTDKGYFTDIDQPFKVTISCTGFVVNPTGYVGTAGHCADLGPEGARADIIRQIVNQDVQKDPTIDASKFFSDAMANWKIEGQAGGLPDRSEAACCDRSRAWGKTAGPARPGR